MEAAQHELQNLEQEPLLQERIEAISKTFSLSESSIEMTYGARIMHDISRFSDDFFSRAQAKESVTIQENLQKLMHNLQHVNVADAFKKPSFLERLPLIGTLFTFRYKKLLQLKDASQEVSRMGDALQVSMLDLLRHVALLDELYKHNAQYYIELVAHIKAGRAIVEKARNEDIPRMQAQLANDDFAAQEVQDFIVRIQAFERRLHDLEISRTITLQMAPQIRLIQSMDRALVQKIQTSMLTTIPIWKNHMSMALALQGQKEAAKLHKDMVQKTNTTLRNQAENMEKTSRDTAKEMQSTFVDYVSLREVHTRLISTVEATLRMAKEGRERLQQLEKNHVN